MGGRAAEIIKFSDITNGAANDIENATNLAHKMVCEWGMSKRLGPLTFGKKESEIFIGREIATHKDYSEETSIAIDQEIRKFVEAAQQHAESIIREHTGKLESLTTELLKREVLAGDEIERILNNTGSPSKRQAQKRKRGPYSRKRAPQTGTDAKAGTVHKSFRSDTEAAKVSGQKSEEKDKTQNKKGDGGSGKKDTGKETSKDSSELSERKTRRTRIIRLKTGGRQRIIRKAPAKKIRKIN